MTISTVTAPTKFGRKYLQQLCKHWGHNFTAEFTPEHGTIDLPFGLVTLDADDETLKIKLAAKPEADLDKFEQVVDVHLQRFAFRESLALNWSRA